MAEISSRDALLLGYVPHVVGIYFNGMAMVREAAEGASGALAEQVREHHAVLEGDGVGVAANVRLCEGLLEAAGLQAPPRPRDLEGYCHWAESLLDTVRARLANSALPAAAFSLGVCLGDAAQTLHLGALICSLHEAAPAHPFLTGQAQRLDEDRKAAAARLQRLLEDRGALFPPPARHAAESALGALADAPAILGTADHEARLDAIEATLAHVSSQLHQIESALVGTTSAA